MQKADVDLVIKTLEDRDFFEPYLYGEGKIEALELEVATLQKVTKILMTLTLYAWNASPKDILEILLGEVPDDLEENQ